MTAYAPAPEMTLRDARDEYFRVNQFGPDGGYHDKYVDLKIGPFPMRMPNSPSRVRAVRFHDLHHALTGYQTDLVGEFEISAWEIATGCADHRAAWVLNLAGMAGGLFRAPVRCWRAFVRGRRSKNLYRATYDDALLGRTVAEMKRELALDAPAGPGGLVDGVLFAWWTAIGLVFALTLGVLFIPFGLFSLVASKLRRPANA